MPKFEDEKLPVSVDTDGENGSWIIKADKRKLTLSPELARALSTQIGYAKEFVELYARGPR